jgi:hypothetical protein
LGGNVDDGITVNALAAAIVAGNHTKGTITAWVMMPDVAGTYTIFSAGDNNSADEFMEFTAIAGKLKFKINDGGVTRVDASTTDVCLKAHTWHHVALVQNAVYPKIYVDGVEYALTFATATEVTQWFDDTDGIDNGCIGALYSNNAYTQEYAGYISDVKVWSGTTDAKALTANQIVADMNGVTVSGGLAWYTFDGVLKDYATGAGTYDGTIVGAIIYVDAHEFASRLTFGCGIPVTADNVQVSISGTKGFATVIQQA